MRYRVLLFVFGLLAQLRCQSADAAAAPPFDLQQIVAQATGLQRHPREDGLLGIGPNYRTRFRAAGTCFEVAAQQPDRHEHVTLANPMVTRRGTTLPTSPAVEPVMEASRAVYRRADGVDERYDVGVDGVELSWRFAQRPDGEGDLVVRYRVETGFGEPNRADRGLLFGDETFGVRIGTVTGIDAVGAHVAGSVLWQDGGLELTLPAAFVDRAVYPIVLDPMVGAAVQLDSGSVYAPDAAFDAVAGNWLVVWRRQVAFNSIQLHSQLVSGTSGGLIGSMAVLDDFVSNAPRLVGNASRGNFGVAYARNNLSGFASVEFVRLSAATGQVLGGHELASGSFAGGYFDVDIGAPSQAGTSAGFTVTYRDPSGGISGIKMRRIAYSGAGFTSAGPAISLWTDVGGAHFTQTAMSRIAGADGLLLAVAHRLSGVNNAIVGTVLDVNSDVPLFSGVLVPDTTAVLGAPDVDGFAGRWVLAYEAPGATLVPGPGVRVRPVSLGTGGQSFVVGGGQSFGGLTSNQAVLPALGYSAGRVWLAYRSQVTFPASLSLRVVALDSASCASCNDAFTIAVPSTSTTYSVATATSGGTPNGEDAMLVWTQTSSTSSSVFAQRLRNHGPNGLAANLGGGCGASGTVTWNHAPGIGSSALRCTLSNIPASTLLPIFNFAPPTATVSCAGCVWTPFAVTQTPPITAGATFVEFAIPCLTALIGQQFETQWTLFDPSQAPCPVFPGLALSERTLLTIGN